MANEKYEGKKCENTKWGGCTTRAQLEDDGVAHGVVASATVGVAVVKVRENNDDSVVRGRMMNGMVKSVLPGAMSER